MLSRINSVVVNTTSSNDLFCVSSGIFGFVLFSGDVGSAVFSVIIAGFSIICLFTLNTLYRTLLKWKTKTQAQK